MKIEHIMSTDLIVLDINSDIYEVAKTMKEKDIGFIPVNEKDKIVGVITDRDIVVKVLANKDNKINDYISRDLVKININESIDKVVELMGINKVKRILVEKDNKLVGIISLSDVINNVNSDMVYESIKRIFEIYRNTDEYITKVDEFKL